MPRHIPTNGPLFLLGAVAGFVFAVLLLAWPRALARLLAASYTAATLGALIISLTVGLFGFRESMSASYVTQSPAIETGRGAGSFTLPMGRRQLYLTACTSGPAPSARAPS